MSAAKMGSRADAEWFLDGAERPNAIVIKESNHPILMLKVLGGFVSVPCHPHASDLGYYVFSEFQYWVCCRHSILGGGRI